MKPLLVGELNPYGADPDMALFPLPKEASGRRLAQILGLSREEYLRRFDRVNLCTERWSLKAARLRADTLLSTAPLVSLTGEPCHFVLLGAKVAKAFGYAFSPFILHERPARPPCAPHMRVYILPHPSGRNPAWRDRAATVRARELLREYLPAPEPLDLRGVAEPLTFKGAPIETEEYWPKEPE